MKRLATCLLALLWSVCAHAQAINSTSPVGGVISSAIAVGAAVSLTTATTANVTSVTLTPGTWLCSGGINFTNSTTASSLLQGGITPTTATLPGFDGNFSHGIAFVALNQNFPIGSIVIAVTANTSEFLAAESSFASGTSKAYGTINCVRIK